MSRLIRRLKVVLCALAAIAVVGFAAGFYFREKATEAGAERRASWSSTGECVVRTYVRDYSELGGLGRFFGFFSGRYYYRVYSKSGDLLKTSEWNLLETETGSDDYARWIYGNVLYPTTNGYGRWALRGCNG